MVKSPDAFRTIGEVSEWLDTPTHVIRFWESRFDEIDPVQKDGGRRYFRPSDLEVMGGLKKLLHEDGLTIKAVQNMIAEQGIEAVTSLSLPLPDGDTKPEPMLLSEPAPSTEPYVHTKQMPEPEQKPMLLVPSDEILEPNHKWHMKFAGSADKAAVQDGLDKLTALRTKLSDLAADNKELTEEIQD